MEQFFIYITDCNNPNTLFVLCGIFIFSDIITGYLKAFKNKKVNSSISRDGYIKKLSWMFALIMGFGIDFIVNSELFLIGSAIVCVATEGISVYENLSELGIKLPFAKYFEKVVSDELESG